MDGNAENRLINAIFEIDIVKKSLPLGEAHTHLSVAIIAATDALEAITRPAAA